MAQPPKYEFESDFTKNHGSVQNDALLNKEFRNIEQAINNDQGNGLRERMALLLKDDNSVKNGIIGLEQLSEGLKTSLDKTIADSALAVDTAISANEKSDYAVTASDNAIAIANNAEENSQNAVTISNEAKAESANALSISQSASATAESANALALSVVDQYNTAIGTANSAISTAGQATNNANTALDKANTALTTANTAKTTATNAQTIASNYAAEIINYENRIDATVANIPTEVDYAVNAKNIPELVSTEVQNALQNVEVAGLTYDTIAGALGFAPADSADLTAEETARTSADATLQANITAEANARTSAISAEATARQNADNALQKKIDNIGDNLATVASSGSYNDLTDKPTIQTAPTKLSQLTDDLGETPTHTHSQYLTQHQDVSHLATNALLNEEINARSSADTALQNQIDNVSTVANNALANTLPPQTGNTGKFLKTDGISPSWVDVDTLPDQTGNAGKVLKTDGTSASWVSPPSGMIVGQNIESLVPLTDAGIHLYDGALITSGGMYDGFVQFASALQTSNPELFCTQAEFDLSVSKYGVCSKFVKSSSGIRLPKLYSETRYLVKSWRSGTEWYNLYSDGWIEQGGKTQTGGTPRASFHVEMLDENYEIFLTSSQTETSDSGGTGNASAALSPKETTYFNINQATYSGRQTYWAVCGYAKETPDQEKIYRYICVATSVKTPVEVTIDNIITDNNNKADRDLGNVVPSQYFKSQSISWGMPDYSAGIAISSELLTGYSAPCDGVLIVSNRVDATWDINGNQWQSSYQTYGNYPLTFMLSKNDVIKVSRNNLFGCYFFPMKGAV